jgi:putative tricarboxylic transport membrane protein
MSAHSTDRTPPAKTAKREHKISWGELSLSLVLLILGLVVLLDGLGQPEAASASGIGAGLFPIIVGVILMLVSAMLVIEVLRGKRGEPEDDEGDIDTSRLAAWQLLLTIAAIIFFILVLEVIGYILSAAITFWAIAFAMGARRHIRSGVIALGISAAIYLLFTQVLRIDLPGGILGGAF